MGLAIAACLARSGASVVLADIDGPEVKTAAETLVPLGLTVRSAEMDVTDVESVERVASLAEDEFGGLDIWVNNAGLLRPTGPIESTDEELFDGVIAVNLRGVFNGCRAAARRMTASGVIVNISSTTAIRAIPYSAAYIASKTAIIGMTRSLALELGVRGIRVLAVAPGFVLTPGSSRVLQDTSTGVDLGPSPSRNPLGHEVSAHDVARVVLFCASDLARAVTGVVIPVDGGKSL